MKLVQLSWICSLTACSGGLHPPAGRLMGVSFTDSEGTAWYDDLSVSAWRTVGTNCEAVTFYVLGGQQFGAEMLVRDSGESVLLNSDTSLAYWLDGALDEGGKQLSLYGGTGATIALDDDHLEYEFSVGQVRYWDNVADLEVSEPQNGPIVIVAEGPFDELVSQETSGEAGRVTDADGDAICASYSR